MTEPQGNSVVPVLITWDVDPDLWLPEESRLRALNIALGLCQQRNIKATFFFTAKLCEIYEERFAFMQRNGYEVGCHGLTHGIEENYDRMPPDTQQEYIAAATDKLNSLLATPVSSFRSPRVKTSATTLNLLAKHGYTADSSVCSQRMDVISSNLINFGWLKAPRLPYHPHHSSAFKRGDIPLWEIPVSALALPFISSTFQVFGLATMKRLFKLLYLESKRSGKPIVYLAHPTEFLGSGKKRISWKEFVGWQYLHPRYIKAHGLRIRNLLYRFSGAILADYTRELFAYMAAFSDVKFMTVNEYTQTCQQKENAG